MTKDLIEDRELAKEIMARMDELELLNDAVGNRAIRHQISEHLVCIRLLARDGHLGNMNGGAGRIPPRSQQS